MALSRLAAQFAAEIALQDWSDSPYRADRAGHQRWMDRGMAVPQLTPDQTETVKLNVMWNVAQVLAYNDPNFDVYDFAEACGVSTATPSGQPRSGHIIYGLRRPHDEQGAPRGFSVPGTYAADGEPAK